MSDVNIALLMEVRDAIARHRRVDMRGWIYQPGDEDEFLPDDALTGVLVEDCGTVGCIAGWAVAVARPDMLVEDVPFLSAEILNLGREQARSLFYLSEWPGDLKHEYHRAEAFRDLNAMARAVVNRIDAFILDLPMQWASDLAPEVLR